MDIREHRSVAAMHANAFVFCVILYSVYSLHKVLTKKGFYFYSSLKPHLTGD